jgi:hypothetical protein
MSSRQSGARNLSLSHSPDSANVTRDQCHESSTAGKHHLMQMSVVLVYFIAFLLLALVVGPALRIEDRPAFKRPDKNVRWLF